MRAYADILTLPRQRAEGSRRGRRLRQRSMIAYILRSLAQAVLVMLAVALLAFSMFRFVGDPVANMVGPGSLGRRSAPSSPSGSGSTTRSRPVRAISSRDMARGEFGMSYRQGRPVTDLLRERVPATVELALLSVAVRARLRHRARRLRGDQPARRRSPTP